MTEIPPDSQVTKSMEEGLAGPDWETVTGRSLRDRLTATASSRDGAHTQVSFFFTHRTQQKAVP